MSETPAFDDLLSYFRTFEERRRGPIVPKTPAPNRVVVFADMLGFATLTERYPVDVRMLMMHDRPLGWNMDAIFSEPKNPLTEAFSRFHYALKWAIDLVSMRNPVTAITFSDSVFLATEHFQEAAEFAANFAESMMSGKVPVRMGIAYGSFAALKFRSTVTADGSDHASQFLGTAVVRAYRAERCGIKGMRILLHPSVEPLLNDPNHTPHPAGVSKSIRTLACPVAEWSHPHNRAKVRIELNYWDLPKGKEAAAWRGFQEMWDATPEEETAHYQATAEAIHRMRLQLGEPPLTKLRRRTLPRARD
jgi:hypothetical protein